MSQKSSYSIYSYEGLCDDLTKPPKGLASAPRTIELGITGKCNLTCRYCFYANEMAALSDLSTDRWLNFFVEIGSIGVQRVTISGGEAFTRPDLFRLIDGIIQNKMRYSILSNGTLITDDTLKVFEMGKRRSRLDQIQISIDGSSAKVHNASRPPDSFDKALRGLCLLVEHDFPVTVRVTINKHNVDDLENIAQLLLEDVGLSGFSTNEADRFGSARCYGQDVLLTPEQRLQSMRMLESLVARYPGRINASAGPLAMAKHFDEIDERVARGETGIPGRGTLCSCGGVFQKMAVLHDGTMTPCNLMPGLNMGKIGETPLKDAWLHSPAINAVRMRRDIPLKTLPACKDCSYTGFCAGGCPATVLAKTGDLFARDSLTCYRLFREDSHVAM